MATAAAAVEKIGAAAHVPGGPPGPAAASWLILQRPDGLRRARGYLRAGGKALEMKLDARIHAPHRDLSAETRSTRNRCRNPSLLAVVGIAAKRLIAGGWVAVHGHGGGRRARLDPGGGRLRPSGDARHGGPQTVHRGGGGHQQCAPVVLGEGDVGGDLGEAHMGEGAAVRREHP